MHPTCVLALSALLGLGACVPPMSPMERLGFSAHEMNAATRFGRMDVALSFVAGEVQAEFVRRHRKWHKDVRIVDVELEGLQMVASDTAEVQLSVRWHRQDETTVRTSQIAQKWSQKSGDWQLAEEVRVSGSPGLFVPPKKQQKKKPAKG